MQPEENLNATDLFSDSEGELLQNTTFVDREKAITQVIGQFNNIIEKEAEVNLQLKQGFFVLCCLILGALTLTLMCMANTMLSYNLPDNSFQFAIELVSVIATFISAFMTLPKIIAQDLFSAKIQESIVRIITEHLHKKE